VGHYVVESVPFLFHVKAAHLVSLRELSKDMIRKQSEIAHIELADGGAGVGRIRDGWLQRVAEMLGWVLERPVDEVQKALYRVELSNGSRWKFWV
jgi:hypothetical protein